MHSEDPALQGPIAPQLDPTAPQQNELRVAQVASAPAATPSSAAEVPAAADDYELPPCHDDQEHDWHPVEVAGRRW